MASSRKNSKETRARSRRSAKRSQKTSSKTAGTAKDELSNGKTRVSALDTLRGLAILLMIVDHAAWLYWDQSISPSSIRFVTRLSMPLFCVLLGYLAGLKIQRSLTKDSQSTNYFQLIQATTNWARVLQILAAVVAINLLYFNLFHQFEILASILIVVLAMALARSGFCIAMLAPLLFPLEATWLVHKPVDTETLLFDFPVTVVACCTAGGFMLGRFGLRPAMLSTLAVGSLAGIDNLMHATPFLYAPPTVYVLYFLPLATVMVWWAGKTKEFDIPVMSWIGRYPITVYLLQYYLLLLFSEKIQ
ncbi:MAG: heparan-alpha-glucosaminide N-acetyltransferase domain-containing protein [Planctomycetota bacterium]